MRNRGEQLWVFVRKGRLHRHEGTLSCSGYSIWSECEIPGIENNTHSSKHHVSLWGDQVFSLHPSVSCGIAVFVDRDVSRIQNINILGTGIEAKLTNSIYLERYDVRYALPVPIQLSPQSSQTMFLTPTLRISGLFSQRYPHIQTDHDKKVVVLYLPNKYSIYIFEIGLDVAEAVLLSWRFIVLAVFS